VIDTISTFNILYDLKVAYRNSSKKGCIQEQQQEMIWKIESRSPEYCF
jgi:hypothetical protein